MELNLIGFLEGTLSGIILLGGAFYFCLLFRIVEFFLIAGVLLFLL